MATTIQGVTIRGISLTEANVPLVGTAEWLINLLERAELKVGNSNRGEPCVWLKWTEGDKQKSECLASFCDAYHEGEPIFDRWPLGYGPDMHDFGGYNLTKPARKVASALGRKAKALLKRRMRSADKVADERLRICLSPVTTRS